MVSRAGPVVVVGDVMTDVVAVDAPLEVPLDIDSATAPQVRTRQGGAGADVAYRLVLAGCAVRFVARVGDDPFGQEAVAGLAAAGVQPHVTVDPVLPTGTVVLLEGPDGERTAWPDAGANSALSPADLPPLDPDVVSWLHVSGPTLLNPGSRAAGESALAGAASSGVPRSVDVVSAAPLEALGGKEFLRLVEGADLLLCRLDEAELLVGTRDVGTALARLTGSVRGVVLTAPDAVHWAGEEADPVAIAASAGDPTLDQAAFTAGYLAAGLAGADVATRLQRAARAAAEVSRGSRP